MIDPDFSLQSARLHLTPLTMAHAPALQALTNDTDILSRISFMPSAFGPDEAASLISGQNAQNRFLAIKSKDDACLAGAFGLHKNDQNGVEIGYWLGKAWQGRGFATECLLTVLDWATQHQPDWKIQAECHPDNKASMGLLVKCGFTDTGAAGHRPGRRLMQFIPG